MVEGDQGVFVGVLGQLLVEQGQLVFGEMAVLCDILRTAAIAAKTDLEVLRIERDAFLSLLKEFPEVSYTVASINAFACSSVSIGAFSAGVG